MIEIYLGDSRDLTGTGRKNVCYAGLLTPQATSEPEAFNLQNVRPPVDLSPRISPHGLKGPGPISREVRLLDVYVLRVKSGIGCEGLFGKS